MALRTLLSRDLKCYMCGAVSGRLIRVATPTETPPKLELSPICPNGPRTQGGRLVCCFCGGSLYLDSQDAELEETQKVYPRERRGRRPRIRPEAADGG